MKKNTIRLITATLLSSLLVSALFLGSHAANREDHANSEVTRVSYKIRPTNKPAKTRPANEPAKTRPANEPAKTRPANEPAKTRPVVNNK